MASPRRGKHFAKAGENHGNAIVQTLHPASFHASQSSRKVGRDDPIAPPGNHVSAEISTGNISLLNPSSIASTNTSPGRSPFTTPEYLNRANRPFTTVPRGLSPVDDEITFKNSRFRLRNKLHIGDPSIDEHTRTLEFIRRHLRLIVVRLADFLICPFVRKGRLSESLPPSRGKVGRRRPSTRPGSVRHQSVRSSPDR